MDEEDQPLNYISTAATIHPLLRGQPTPAMASFSLPLTRYPTRLLAAAERGRAILAGDDGDGDEEGEGSGESCAYSKPILVLDVVWNLAFVLVSALVLFSTFHEKPSTPLRVWVCGYAFQCLLHVALVCVDHRRRNFSDLLGFSAISLSHTRTSIMKKLESVNTVVSSVWWMFGFYWIVVGGQTLLQGSPRLYWLTVIFLAFDVFFIIFCVAMAFLIFFVLCFCVPIVTFAYSIFIKDGASDDDIRNLPKYRLHQNTSSMALENNKNQEILRAQLESGCNSYVNEFVLSPEDSECCICLSQYVDGAELCALPCSHHFHCGCISKWLRINATCPLCKFNILHSDTLV